MSDLSLIDNKWTLFLDRDGVINHEKPDYVFSPEEFKMYDGVPEAMKIFNRVFGRIIIATNQRGIGRGLMTDNDLHAIHEKMLSEIQNSGGRIDRIYYCSSVDDSDPARKPNPGLALQAFADDSFINRNKALMVGNNISDMQFGRNAGIGTVLLTTTGTRVALPHPLVDLQFDSLLDFARVLK